MPEELDKRSPNYFRNRTPGSIKKSIDAYFAYCKKNKKPISITGLALHLKCTRAFLMDYKVTDDLGPIIQEAKLRCENSLEEKMIQGTPPTGIIFILKNNYGWKDKVEIDQNVNGRISLSTLFDQAAQKKAIAQTTPIEGEIVNKESSLIGSNESLPEDLF